MTAWASFMQIIIDVLANLSWLLLIIVGMKILFFVTMSTRHFMIQKKDGRKRIGKYKPLVSIIVPCYNEELTLKNCVRSLLRQSYKNFQIIIIDDGSSDGTKELGQLLESKYPSRIKFFSKQNGGKATALNYGIMRADGEIVVSMDADSMFLKDTVRQLVLSFNDPDIVAVSGNVKVANRRSFFGMHQAIEYITGLNFQRRTFAQLGCMQVISGAIGAFRKAKLLEVGGYSSDTIVEDMDITVSLARRGYKVDYNGTAVAYTEAPESIGDFLKQRHRWTFGGFQVLQKHNDLIFNPKFGRLGMIGMPYFLLFPWIDVIITVLLVFIAGRVIASGGLWETIIFSSFMSVVQGCLIYYALYMDSEDKKLLPLSVLENLWYGHLISLVTVKAGIHYLKGSEASWNKLVRLGKNYAPGV